MLATGLLTLLALPASATQEPAWQQHAGDPLHQFMELDVGPGGAAVEHVAAFDGTLHVWVRSDVVDPSLRVEFAGGTGILEDEDSGGGTTAWLELEVLPEQALEIRVLASGEAAALRDRWVARSQELRTDG